VIGFSGIWQALQKGNNQFLISDPFKKTLLSAVPKTGFQ
jgi:hypothetical protein